MPGSEQAGGGALANIEDINGMAADRTALAGYTVHFAYDSSAVRKSEKANVQAAADALSRESGTKLMIEGNCDERGTDEYNRSLGERRALAVRKELVKRGIDPMRVFTKSYGKDRPVDSGHDESAWSKNRRDDFVLLHPKSGS
jgi:peptidoglycan-associated lipoprotein